MRYQPALQAVMVRAGGFMVFAIALVALLPLIARQELGRGPTAYGVLLGALGVGAVTGGLLVARLRERLPGERFVRVGTTIFAICAVIVAHVRIFPLLVVVMWLAGVWWLVLMSSFHVAAQGAVAGWVRARALSVYLLVFAGSMATGSALWGALATQIGTPWSLTVAAVGMVLSLVILERFPLPAFEGQDLSPSEFTPAPRVDTPFDRGPVMVTVRYQVEPADRPAFETVMEDMERHRRRSGAIAWSLYEDPQDPAKLVEVFLVDSWLEHLRQHERATVSDAEIRARARALHRGEEPPEIAHLLALD